MVHHGRDRVQISGWKARDDVANLVPFPSGERLTPDAVRHAVDSARDGGYERAYTAAMSPQQAVPFLDSGFELFEELHLLERRLDGDPGRERGGLRRGRRADYDAVLSFDRLAFDEFWQFDRSSLADAMRATPRYRFQVTRTTPVVGYHVTGLAASNAYLQRIAVHPDSQGQGWGRRLVEDALQWAWRNGAARAHVNTQISNERAFSLYERCGFVAAPHRLQVLYRVFD